MNGLTVSVILLWLAVIVLALMLWALSRQVGVLFERVAPMGALMTDAGPTIGDASPMFELTSLQGQTVSIGLPHTQATLLFFLSPNCPVCKNLLPVIQAMVRDEKQQWRVILASDGEAPAHLAFIQSHHLSALPYVLSTELGMTYRVSRLPYAVVMDPTGRVTAKGLVNSREQLDSLLNAHDMGTPSIQHYLQSQPA